MEHGIQKFNNSEQSGMEVSLPFLFEPLRAAPTTLSGKQVSNTGSDSGVNYPHVLSPEMPVTPDISHHPQPYLMPSISRMNPPIGPLTPIQYFIHISRKSKNKELKYNCSQHDHPDSQSVLRTRNRQGYNP